MNREFTTEDRDKIIPSIIAGDRIGATNNYISITGCGLTAAQDFIRALTAEVNAGKLEKAHKK